MNKPDGTTRFYAVTTTSTYEVFVEGNKVTTKKVAIHTPPSVGVGTILQNGDMLAISAGGLIAYVPEGSGRLSPRSTVQRRIEDVNTAYWGGHTSPIIALFNNRVEADLCAENANLQQADPRWLRKTQEVLRKIGDNHPLIYIYRGQLLGSLLAPFPE